MAQASSLYPQVFPFSSWYQFENWAKNYGFKLVDKTDIGGPTRPECLFRHVFAHRRRRLIMVVVYDYKALGAKIAGNAYGTVDLSEIDPITGEYLLRHAYYTAVSHNKADFRVAGYFVSEALQMMSNLRHVVWNTGRIIDLPVVESMGDDYLERRAQRWKEFLQASPQWVRNFIVGNEGEAVDNGEFFTSFVSGSVEISISYDPDSENGTWTVQAVINPHYSSLCPTWVMHTPVTPEKIARLSGWVNVHYGLGIDKFFDARAGYRAELAERICEIITSHIGHVAVLKGESPI